MLKFFRTKLIIPIFAMSTLSVSVTSCDEEGNFDWDAFLELLMSMLGWDIDKERQSLDDQETADEYDETTDGPLSSSADLSRYFPPVGDQGQYGTCVAWATGYAMKTALNAKQNGWSSSQLASASNQTSPIDLWHVMSTKATGCNGSNFEPAMDAMKMKGVASMSQAPFTNKKMTCDGVSGIGSTSNRLGEYKIIAYTNDLSGSGNYGMSVNNFKYWLDKGYPIMIGAELGEKFMAWNSSNVITSDTKGYNGQHAYHAIVVVGYDDNKQAFRIRNSWDSTWGDNGSIWVGYSHFINQFCFGAWVATNPGESLANASVESLESGLRSTYQADLSTNILADYENEDGTRTLEYNILNEGGSVIPASKKWSAVYMLYKAKRINEHYLLMHDYYGTEAANGKIEKNDEGVAAYKSASTVTNISVAPGSSVAEALGGSTLKFNYKLPNDKNGEPLNGEYYMVLMVNAFGNYKDSNLENNYSFVSAGEEPLKIVNGMIVNMPSKLTDVRTLVTDKNWNTYTGVALNNMLLRHFNNGKLKKQIQNEEGLKSARVAKSVK